MDIQTRPTTVDLPYYEAAGNEVEVFERAWRNRLPLLIKGPTGCGKTRFVSFMAAKLGLPLYTVACHDDLTAADLVGRHLIGDGETFWSDGPLTRAVREGGICYLDEIVEARKDTTVVLHRWPMTGASCRSTAPGSNCGRRTASCWSSPTTPATRISSRG